MNFLWAGRLLADFGRLMSFLVSGNDKVGLLNRMNRHLNSDRRPLKFFQFMCLVEQPGQAPKSTK
jgi:hypothetical protein